jgi:nucleotide-binding universal stress UspA family protein
LNLQPNQSYKNFGLKSLPGTTMMLDIKKILFATDLSANSRFAFNYAVSIAVRFGGGITIVHVLESLPDSVEYQLNGFLGKAEWNRINSEREKEVTNMLLGKRRDLKMIEDSLEKFCQNETKKSTSTNFILHEICVKEGDVVEEILGLAREKECELIVMGAHRGILKNNAIGKVAKGILRNTGIPTIVIPPPKT